MNIGILTYHFSINYGAVLQCFALQEALKNLGYSVYIINFVSAEQKDNIGIYRECSSFHSIIKNLALLPFHFQRKKRNQNFASFLAENLNCTKLVRGSQEVCSIIQELNISTIFVGSDQVWNPLIKDFNNIFFLSEIPTKKIGYAVSLGKATETDLYKYRTSINSFDCITVREKSAKAIINKLTGRSTPIALDPTFLLDVCFWKDFANDIIQPICGDYMVCYFLNAKRYKSNIEQACYYAKMKKYKLVLLDSRVSLESVKHHGIISAGPKEFLQYIKNARLVITDSFHGTVFSILLNKPFFSINNNIVGNDTRRSELLALLSLESQYISSVNLMNNIELPEINYSEVNMILKRLKTSDINQLQLLCNNVEMSRQ